MKDNVVFMMIDLTDGKKETLAKGSKYISDNNYTFPVYYDVKLEAANNYGIKSIPITLFIDKDGNIIDRQEGPVSEATLRNFIELINP